MAGCNSTVITASRYDNRMNMTVRSTQPRSVAAWPFFSTLGVVGVEYNIRSHDRYAGHSFTNISQGNVATHLRGDGIFYHYRFTTNLLLSLTVNEF